ncbi:MAG TPA: hypothetical protein VF712_16750 [Thermoleophilaceae bacterium]
MSAVESHELWKAFAARADVTQQALVLGLIERAEAVLDRVIETFPTYTLHSRVHAENVVRLMGELLGERVEDLSALEAAMLLLAAYYHDIGMVFDEDERAKLREEEAFPEFLDKHPTAYIAVEQSDEQLPREIAEWYCRWRHADRVHVWLDRLPEDELLWGVVSLREPLASVCLSHNQGAADLGRLPTEFADDCDLRFCAVVLRLADILDFDRSRSPADVYGYLGLTRASSPRTESSDVEWRKHLATDGFRFPAKRPGPYPLGFVAGPDDPAVEHDLREFLDVIEAELHESAVVVGGCAPKWRDLPLPDRIKRNNILSRGYKYGEHRFVLDREQVLQLFMGENLYESPYTFIRELLQNALDASRHREFVERSRGNAGFASESIRVEQFVDEDHYRWIRIEDSGMGMNETIIKDHFLTVGSSYYRSDSFRADLLRLAAEREFTPISRFGIGVLSCFVPGDRVELSTRRLGPGGDAEDPIRLSLSGLKSFYTLQAGSMRPRAMPGPNGDEPGYRREPGTTIAVRLDATREVGSLDLGAVLAQHVVAPPVPIEHEGKRVGGDPAEILGRPWCEPRTHRLGGDVVAQVEAMTGETPPAGLRVKVVPLDVTASSPTSELRGQLTALYLVGSQASSEDTLSIRFNDGAIQLWAERASGNVTLSGDLVSVPSEIRTHFEPKMSTAFEGPLVLTHNGIVVPRRYRSKLGFDEDLGLNPLGPWRTSRGAMMGCLALSDRLRPDVSVSRDELRGLPWEVQSAINLATRRALRAAKVPSRLVGGRSTLSMDTLPRRPALREVASDSLMTDPEGWLTEPIIEVGRGSSSIAEIRARWEAGDQVKLRNTPALWDFGENDTFSEPFDSLCVNVMLELHLELAIAIHGKETACYVRGLRDASAKTPRLLFPPLFFVSYESSDALKHSYAPVNAGHPFAAWLLESAEVLSLSYPGTLLALRRALATGVEKEDRAALAEAIGSLIERLRNLDPELAPPKAIVPSADAFR